MPIEFVHETCTVYGHYTVCDSTKLVMAYDGSGRRISKTRMKKTAFEGHWYASLVTHYTGIGSEIRKEYHNGELQSTKVVVNMPKGLGRYGIENADGMAKGDEFYLKNHLGSTMMVAQVSSTNASEPAEITAAYDYRAFGEQVTLKKSADKVTENFTGKEKDDETELNYFGARYLDPMLGVWTSVDPMRQFASPYLYAGNGVNPVNGVDGDGNVFVDAEGKALYQRAVENKFWGNDDIRREYEFANTTNTKITVKSQFALIKGEYLGLMSRGTIDAMNIDYYGVDDDYKLKEAKVTLSTFGIFGYAQSTNTTFDEAEARVAAHEFGAHIRNFTPNNGPKGESPADIEHDKFKAVDQRLDTPRRDCKDE